MDHAKTIDSLRRKVRKTSQVASNWKRAFYDLAEEKAERDLQVERLLAIIETKDKALATLRAQRGAIQNSLGVARFEIEELESALEDSRDKNVRPKRPEFVWTIYHCPECNKYDWAQHARDSRAPERNHLCERRKNAVEALYPEKTDPSENDLASLEREWGIVFDDDSEEE